MMNNPFLEDFVTRVREERIYQDAKWGIQRHEGHAWLGILAEEFGEAAKAVNEGCHPLNLGDELVQVAAVCCAMYEAYLEYGLHPQFGGV
jgi:NTP pyrophosphatase (non-canonical NTP hydrolase)